MLSMLTTGFMEQEPEQSTLLLICRKNTQCGSVKVFLYLCVCLFIYVFIYLLSVKVLNPCLAIS